MKQFEIFTMLSNDYGYQKLLYSCRNCVINAIKSIVACAIMIITFATRGGHNKLVLFSFSCINNFSLVSNKSEMHNFEIIFALQESLLRCANRDVNMCHDRMRDLLLMFMLVTIPQAYKSIKKVTCAHIIIE